VADKKHTTFIKDFLYASILYRYILYYVYHIVKKKEVKKESKISEARLASLS